MERMSVAEIATYTFEAVALGAIVVHRYFAKRKDRRNAPAPTDFDFQNSAPFNLAYAVNKEIAASSNNEITPSLHLYFNKSDRCRISYQQFENIGSAREKSHRYFLRISQHDITDLEWLSVESRIGLVVPPQGSRMVCQVTACASEFTQLKLILIYQIENEAEKRVELGTQPLTTKYSVFQMSVDRNDYNFGASDGALTLRFAILPEIKAGFSIDIRSWDFNVVKPT